MNFTLATKTLQAFEDAVAYDQGAAYRQHLERVLPHIGDAYRGHDDPFRSHLGSSVIGKECERAIWYGWRWAAVPHFEGRMLRLFNRGHLEEGRLIALLITIGMQIYQQDENGKQFRISDHGGHFGGSGDGVGIGCPDLRSDQAALLEMKTHNDKSFKNLQVKGVKDAKFEHWVQMQTYMRKMGLAVALYLAVNKNDDMIHAELVAVDTLAADRYIERAGRIIWMQQPPPKIADSSGWSACKFCDYKPVCKQGAMPAMNCRTCHHAEPQSDGNWICTSTMTRTGTISKQLELTGCEHYFRLI
jgi:hypothetical protein